MGLNGFEAPNDRLQTGSWEERAPGCYDGSSAISAPLRFQPDSMVDASTLPSPWPQVRLNVLLVDARTSSYIWHLAFGIWHLVFGHLAFS